MMNPDDLPEMRRLWEDTPQNASQIGALFGVSRNVIVGQAFRRGWTSFNKPKSQGDALSENSNQPWPYERTMAGRLDALHAAFDRVVSGA